MTMMNRMFFLTLSCLVVCIGCGKTSEEVQTVDVSGVVTLDGKPVEGAEVNFFSKVGNFLGTGVTDQDGKYTLYQGAALGENQVWISKDTSKSDTNPAGMDPAENPDADPSQMAAAAGTEGDIEAKGEQIPEKFSDPDKTVLKFNVQEGGSSNADFKLTE
ncbi:MAG: carboxypeptidase regulatory-like domain-containing protein [Planctomycetaceae bacterium]|nr:carboxypeptidase regulatory-like domain-containing protein [Planctomycetaceae bacterium]